MSVSLIKLIDLSVNIFSIIQNDQVVLCFPSQLFISSNCSHYCPDLDTLQNDPEHQKHYIFFKKIFSENFSGVIRFDDEHLFIEIVAAYPPSLSIQYGLEKLGITLPSDQQIDFKVTKTTGDKGTSYLSEPEFTPTKWSAHNCIKYSSVETKRYQLLDERFCSFRDTFFSSSKKLVTRRRTDVSQFSELLQSDFIIGNSHLQLAHFQFLITNMQLFKDSGYDTLFVEFLPYEMQVLLDDYFYSSMNMMPCLEEYIKERWPEGLRISLGNEFVQLIKTAKRCGIRTVGLENKFTIRHNFDDCAIRGFEETSTSRYTDFSYSAFQIIQREIREGRSRKWIAHVGNAHVDVSRNIPGLSQLTGANALYIFDNDAKTTAECTVNTPFAIGDEYQFLCQFLLEAKPGANLDMRTLCSVRSLPIDCGSSLFGESSKLTKEFEHSIKGDNLPETATQVERFDLLRSLR